MNLLFLDLNEIKVPQEHHMCSITEAMIYLPTGTLTILEQLLISVALRKFISSSV